MDATIPLIKLKTPDTLLALYDTKKKDYHEGITII